MHYLKRKKLHRKHKGALERSVELAEKMRANYYDTTTTSNYNRQISSVDLSAIKKIEDNTKKPSIFDLLCMWIGGAFKKG